MVNAKQDAIKGKASTGSTKDSKKKIIAKTNKEGSRKGIRKIDVHSSKYSKSSKTLKGGKQATTFSQKTDKHHKTMKRGKAKERSLAKSNRGEASGKSKKAKKIEIKEVREVKEIKEEEESNKGAETAQKTLPQLKEVETAPPEVPENNPVTSNTGSGTSYEKDDKDAFKSCSGSSGIPAAPPSPAGPVIGDEGPAIVPTVVAPENAEDNQNVNIANNATNPVDAVVKEDKPVPVKIESDPVTSTNTTSIDQPAEKDAVEKKKPASPKEAEKKKTLDEKSAGIACSGKKKDEEAEPTIDVKTPGGEEEDEEESTKPTINQMKKPNRKLRPLSQAETMTSKEYEQLNDELTELHTSVQTLKHSYGSIMNSLVALQKRRPKKNRKAQQKFGLISTPSTTEMDIGEMSKQQNEGINPYDIPHFLNPLTRDETFKMLFSEIDKIQTSTEKFRTCFDSRGQFLKQKFNLSCGKQITRTVYNFWTFQTHRLQTIVDEIIRNYNDDLLNLFRL